jgi:hypothetical protein
MIQNNAKAQSRLPPECGASSAYFRQNVRWPKRYADRGPGSFLSGAVLLPAPRSGICARPNCWLTILV